jgi:phosphoribosylformylglycinamidine synthase
VSIAFKAAGESIVLVGDTAGHLGASLFLREVAGREEGAPPPVDLKAERRNGDFVRGQIAAGRVTACHDLSDGGLWVAVAEMALAGGIGADLQPPAGAPPLHAWLFGEDQARYLLAVDSGELAPLLEAAAAAGVPAQRLGELGGDALTLARHPPISLAELRAATEGWLPALMQGARGAAGDTGHGDAG